MNKPGAPDISLEAIRREIDAIDDGLLALLERRFEAVEQVRAAKAQGASAEATPLRPGREAEILRRLLGARRGLIPPDLLVRIWRAIMSAAAAAQAPMTVHVSRKFNAVTGNRLRVRDHFGTLAVEEWRDEAQALTQVNAMRGDLCVVEAESPWADPFSQGRAGEARIIGCLPFLRDAEVPTLLVIGHAPADRTGSDETVIISEGRLPRDFAPVPIWQVKSGARRVSCLPGFLSEHESPLVGLTHSNAGLGLIVAGRYPSPFEIAS
jgi:chorismate mutase